MERHPNANATSIFTSSGKAAREFSHKATASMVGVNIGVAAPMAYFPFGGARDSFFGDLKVHGRDAFDFWFDAAAQTGRSAIIVTDGWRPLYTEVRAQFTTVEEVGSVAVGRFGYPIDRYTLYLARGFDPRR